MPIGCDLHRIGARNHLRPTRVRGPVDHAGKLHRVGVAKIPYKPVQPRFGRRLRKRAPSLILFQSLRLLGFGLGGELIDQLARAVLDADHDIGRRLRLQAVVEHHAVRRVLARVGIAPETASAKASANVAVGLLGREQMQSRVRQLARA